MQPLSRSDKFPLRKSLQRFNEILGEMNAMLCAIALGLAVLDVTCLMTLTVVSEFKKAHQSMALAKPYEARVVTFSDLLPR